MHKLKRIRDGLGATQWATAQGLGCTQANAGHGEKGRALPSGAAARLIAFSARQALAIGFDQVCGAAPLSDLPDKGAPTTGLHGGTAAHSDIGTARAPVWPALRWCQSLCTGRSDRRNGKACEAGVLAFQKRWP